MDNIFFQLTSILIIAGLTAVIISLLKQPSIIAYILTGLIVGPLGYYHLHQKEVFEALGQIGTTLLLFMVGLELDVSQLKRIGRSVLYTGIGQVALTSAAGFLLLRALHFSAGSAWLLALALTFSSTIIVVKLLTEKRDLQSLYGKLVVGIFLTQDVVAILVLIGLSSLSPGAAGPYANLPIWQNLAMLFVRSLILVLAVSWLSSKVFPKILKIIGQSDELLLVFGLGWALGLATFVALPFMGLTLEIGGFLAGLALAKSAVHYEISARIKSLRDFFIIIFFIALGSQLVFTNAGALSGQALIISAFVLVGNPLIVMLLLAGFGFKPRTGFLAGVTVGQISEFSLILGALGYKLGILSGQELGLLTLVGILTFSLSSYTILYANRIFDFLRPLLKVLDFRKGAAEKGLQNLELKNHIVLVGAHRMGHHLVDTLLKQKKPFVIVDFNPEIIERYVLKGLPAICGDISDVYIQDQVNLRHARLVISTVPDINDNLALIDAVKKQNLGRRGRTKLIFVAQDEAEIKALYSQDIDYVISPHFMSGLHLAKILEDDSGFKSLKKLREGHLKLIRNRA